jgi:hypothetical protein
MERETVFSLEYKENTDTYKGLIATTHPDKVGDILSKQVLVQIKDSINNKEKTGDTQGSYRSISLAHDWIKLNNPDLDEVGFFLPGTAKVKELPDGHFGVEAEFKLNNHYRGDMSIAEIKERIEMGHFGGLSIEYEPDPTKTKEVNIKGKTLRFIDGFVTYAGTALARARKIANPHAVLYKEVANMVKLEEKEEKIINTKEDSIADTSEQVEEVVEEKVEEKQPEQMEQAEIKPETKEVKADETVVETAVETKEETPDLKIQVKEILQDKEFWKAVDSELDVKSKVIKTKETEQMENNTMNLSIKEMNSALEKNDVVGFRSASSLYFKENEELEQALRTTGVPLNTTLTVKCDGTKLRIMDKIQFKDTLDTTTNPTSYTQNIAELADIYLPGLIDTFNTQTNLFGALRKVDHLEGTDRYGWRIRTTREESLSVDPNDTAVTKRAVGKLKLQTPIKEYRLGVSVTDYMLYHSRGSMADLFRVELEVTMKDIMTDINKDLYGARVDDTTAILGLEGVAKSATYTSIYGLVRSAANRLAPDTAADTFQDINGALTTAKLREALRKPEIEGALRGNLRIVTNPALRDKLAELNASLRRHNSDAQSDFGFDVTGHTFDGVPIIYDAFCPVNKLFVSDFESNYVVVSRPPQVIGLARVGAAEEAFVSIYLAHVYENPRRIHQLDRVS